jgi:hypothetical protein
MTQLRILSIGVLVVVCLSGKVFAQQAQEIWIGASAGLDLGTFYYTPPTPYQNSIGWKGGFAFGGRLDYWFTDNIAATVEPSYIQKGASSKAPANNGLGDGYKSTVTFSYFQLPVFVKVTYGELPFKPYFFAGPSIGFEVTGSATTTFNGQTSTDDIADSEVVRVNISLVGGIGVACPIGSSIVLFFESAYDFGLTNINPTASKKSDDFVPSPYVSSPYVYTRDIRASLGILFKL